MMVYSFVGFFRPAIYIFLLPVYLSALSESEYGLFDLMMITGGLLMIVVTLRLSAAMLTHYYDYYKDETLKRKFLSSLFSFSILIALVVGLLLFIFGERLFDSVFSSDDVVFYPYGCYILLYAMLQEVNVCYYTFLKNEKNLLGFVFITLFQIILVVGFQMLFILVLERGVGGALLGMLIANVITTVVIIAIEKDIITLKPDMSMIRSALSFTVPLMPYLLIYWFLTKGGKFILENYADLRTVGIFALLIQITGVIILLTEAVVNGIRPFLFELYADQQEDRRSAKIDLLTQIIISLPLIAIPVIILIGTHIDLITSKSAYWEITTYLTTACLAGYLLVHAKLYYQQLIFVKGSNTITLLSFVAMLAFGTALYLLVPIYEIWGVIWSTMIANGILSLLFYLSAQRRFYVPYSLATIFVVPGFFFLMLFGLSYLCLTVLGLSWSAFGLIQFLVLSIGLALVYKPFIAGYKRLYM